MRLCRFDHQKLGLVEDGRVYDVTKALERLPPQRWPLGLGDPLIAHLSDLGPALLASREAAESLPVDQVALNSPIAWPTKIMAAPANYRRHVELDTLDPGVDQGVHRQSVINLARPVDTYGIFLKASSSLVGPAEGITLGWPNRRCDHEVELAVVIGHRARDVRAADAFRHIAGYAVGLDITVRGAEDRSFRKSGESFAVLGPWLVTADEIDDPENVTIWLEVNGQRRQQSSTGEMTVKIAELIEIASRVYTLYPGDILMTGTPEGVGPLSPGDVVRAGCDAIGEMTVRVHGDGRHLGDESQGSKAA